MSGRPANPSISVRLLCSVAAELGPRLQKLILGGLHGPFDDLGDLAIGEPEAVQLADRLQRLVVEQLDLPLVLDRVDDGVGPARSVRRVTRSRRQTSHLLLLPGAPRAREAQDRQVDEPRPDAGTTRRIPAPADQVMPQTW